MNYIDHQLSNATFHRRCTDLFHRLRRLGIGKRPAYIEPRVERQALREAIHNLGQTQRARAARRHARKHDQLTMQAKDFKVAYDACGRHPTIHAERKPHELLVALRQTTL